MVEMSAVFCHCLLWLLHRDNRCMYISHACFMSVVVTVRESVGMLAV